MADRNIFQSNITPRKPSVLKNEQIRVYSPVADTKGTRGISSYDDNHFVVNKGFVTLKIKDPFDNYTIVKLSNEDFKMLSETDRTILINFPYAHDGSGSKNTDGYGLIKIDKNSLGHLRFNADGLLEVDVESLNLVDPESLREYTYDKEHIDDISSSVSDIQKVIPDGASENNKLIDTMSFNNMISVDIGNNAKLTGNYEASTGILTLNFVYNEDLVSSLEFDLPLELLVKSGYYDTDDKSLKLILSNDELISIPVADLIDEYYADNTTLELIDVDGKQTFGVKKGSISKDYLTTDVWNNIIFRESTSNRIYEINTQTNNNTTYPSTRAVVDYVNSKIITVLNTEV